jgi:hypothetical protein
MDIRWLGRLEVIISFPVMELLFESLFRDSIVASCIERLSSRELVRRIFSGDSRRNESTYRSGHFSVSANVVFALALSA